MSGIGLRLWEISQLLSKHFKITIYVTEMSDLSHPNIDFEIFHEGSWRNAIDQSDTIITSDIPDTRIILYAHQKRKQIIVENSVPIEHIDYDNIKNSSNSSLEYQKQLDYYKLQILLADHFIARSSPERIGLISSLALLGRLNYKTYINRDLSNMISYIPIGFNSYSETHAENARYAKVEYDFLWNGGVWGLYDLQSIAKAMQILNLEGVKTDLKFLYNPPADQNKVINEFNNELSKHKINSIEFINENIKHYDRDIYLKKAKGLLCVGRKSIENFTCHRLRLRDVFLYKKPIIIDEFGATSELVQQLGIGFTIKNESELSKAMKELINNKNLYSKLVENIESAREQFLMDSYINNLVEFIKSKDKAPDIIDQSNLKQFLKGRPWLLQKQESSI